MVSDALEARTSTDARQRAVVPDLPAVVVGRVHHVRYHPLRHAFTHRHDQWLVDLDAGTGAGPVRRRVADVRPADHLDGPPSWGELKAQVLHLLQDNGIDPGPVTRVLLLAQARVLGHVFDPLSTYWCLAADGSVVAAVLEVRNTYAGRRCYVVRPDHSGRADVTKDFVVSPFNTTDGSYAVRLTLSPTRVATSIALSRDGIPLLTAATWGRPLPATRTRVLTTLLTSPLMPQRVSLLIRWHGVRLWLRRLPILTPKEQRR